MKYLPRKGTRSFPFNLRINSENTSFDWKDNNWNKGRQSHCSKIRTMWESRTITNWINTCIRLKGKKKVTAWEPILYTWKRHYSPTTPCKYFVFCMQNTNWEKYNSFGNNNKNILSKKCNKRDTTTTPTSYLTQNIIFLNYNIHFTFYFKENTHT